MLEHPASRDKYTATAAPVIAELRRCARTLTRNSADAEDLLQDTLLRAYTKISPMAAGHQHSWLAVRRDEASVPVPVRAPQSIYRRAYRGFRPPDAA
ncbi:sigma factor [Inquilinus ginsengisoli]|uniref:sigma factor n=1 Tax=Inquilinus ginsengisoli TaxID=363840 RepID=UPI003D20B408